MAEETSRTSRSSVRREAAGVGDVVDLVKEYAKQETLGPLKGAGRWLALGSLGQHVLALVSFWCSSESCDFCKLNLMLLMAGSRGSRM